MTIRSILLILFVLWMLTCVGSVNSVRADIRNEGGGEIIRFPIGDREGNLSRYLALDPYPFWNERYAKKGSDFTHYMLLDCPTHRHGSIADASSEIARRYAEIKRKKGETVAFIYLCEVDRLNGLRVFGHSADAAMVSLLSERRKVGEPFELPKEYDICSAALKYVSPHPWFAWINCIQDDRYEYLKRRPPSTEEIAFQVWTALGHGAKGLHFWGAEKHLLSAGIGPLVSQIREFEPFLECAEVKDIKDIHHGKVRQCLLQAEDEGIMLIILNSTIACSDDPLGPSTVELLRDIHIEFDIPEGLEIAEKPLNYPDFSFDTESGKCSFLIPRLRYYSVFQIPLRRRDE